MVDKDLSREIQCQVHSKQLCFFHVCLLAYQHCRELALFVALNLHYCSSVKRTLNYLTLALEFLPSLDKRSIWIYWQGQMLRKRNCKGGSYGLTILWRTLYFTVRLLLHLLSYRNLQSRAAHSYVRTRVDARTLRQNIRLHYQHY